MMETLKKVRFIPPAYSNIFAPIDFLLILSEYTTIVRVGLMSPLVDRRDGLLMNYLCQR